MKIYVNNLSSSVTETDLKKLFEQYAEVESIEIFNHQFGDKTRNFAYLEIPSDKDALKAMDSLYGTNIKGNTIKINKARTGPEDRRMTDRGGGRRNTDPPPN